MDAQKKRDRSGTAVREWLRGGSFRSVPLVKLLKNSKGLALFMSIAMMTIFLFFLSASLYLTRVETKITSNLKLSTQALEVADAGLQHALALIPAGYHFNKELNCDPSCPLVPQSDFPSAGSAFSYTVTARNDPLDGGGATNDTDKTVILASTAEGPAGTLKTVEAYVTRSVNPFTAPSALYVNASSATSHDLLFFDDDDSVAVIGYDTNPGDILDPWDDSAGPEPSELAITTTSAAVTSALQNELNDWGLLHYILGSGGDPSLGTTANVIDVNQVAESYINHPNAVKYDVDGLVTSGSSCSSPCQLLCTSSSPCEFGTPSSPQITYIKDSVSSSTVLNGHVRGHGVLVVEGRITIGGDFKFNGLVIHKRSDSTHYVSLENNAWIYGGMLLGDYNGEAKFTIKDFVQLFYSSQALSMVETEWGSILPSPARVAAWQDK